MNSREIWSEEKCLKLIREYKSRPVLWDPTHPYYYRKGKKLRAWMEMGKCFNTDRHTCKHKMNVMMSAFRREKAKILKSVKGDISKPYISNWFAFDAMSFLLVKNKRDPRPPPKPKKPEGKCEHCGSTTKSNTTTAQASTSTATSTTSTVTTTTTQQKTPIPSLFHNHTVKKITTQTQEPSTSESEDNIKTFSEFIISKMKNYSETTKNAVQQNIYEILYKADQNDYENEIEDLDFDENELLLHILGENNENLERFGQLEEESERVY